ncbi:actin cortical patch SUR7/pH-response regulator pali [Mycena belliarum]|uniref:Actin cortical patch SUR7/pH-response regulator pali n=1 Tax=Mycena belliarum TaxID=1033014 RepID=A0AAD6XMG0_9AGAR|nr:actin cortical patch SUR7/pH-response regulator pali [Mycena belliae]
MVSWNKILGLMSVAAATILLGMVAFDVPYVKSVYFLRIDLGNGTASTLAANQTNPFIDLGVLGFCTDLKDGRGLQCSEPQVGYNLTAASKFLNGTLPPQLSASVNAVASTLTKVLVLHLAAFAIALLSFAFAVLAFLGAPIADCCASCFCGFAGAAAFAVFVFDIAFFALIKRRVQEEGNAAAAVMGNALYLTLFAFLLLFVTPLLFLIGRCCGCCIPDMSSDHEKRKGYN